MLGVVTAVVGVLIGAVALARDYYDWSFTGRDSAISTAAAPSPALTPPSPTATAASTRSLHPEASERGEDEQRRPPRQDTEALDTGQTNRDAESDSSVRLQRGPIVTLQFHPFKPNLVGPNTWSVGSTVSGDIEVFDNVGEIGQQDECYTQFTMFVNGEPSYTSSYSACAWTGARMFVAPARQPCGCSLRIAIETGWGVKYVSAYNFTVR